MKCVCGEELDNGVCPRMMRELQALTRNHMKRTGAPGTPGACCYWDNINRCVEAGGIAPHCACERL